MNFDEGTTISEAELQESLEKECPGCQHERLEHWAALWLGTYLRPSHSRNQRIRLLAMLKACVTHDRASLIRDSKRSVRALHSDLDELCRIGVLYQSEDGYKHTPPYHRLMEIVTKSVSKRFRAA